MQSFLIFILCIFLELPSLLAGQNDFDCSLLHPVDGKPVAARIVSCDKNWQIVWQILPNTSNGIEDAKSRTIAGTDLYYWGCWKPAGTGQQLLLRDGGRVIGYLNLLDANEIKFDSTMGLESIVIPTASVRGLIFQASAYQKHMREIHAQKDKAQQSARVILLNGDEQTGDIVSWTAGKLVFKTKLGQLSLDQNNLAALLFPDAPASANEKNESPTANDESKMTAAEASKHVWLGFQDGTRVIARQLELTDAKWHISLTGGGQIVAERAALSAIQPLDGRVRYLSDLEPDGYKHIPWLGTHWNYERDRNVLQTELQSQGKSAVKGLGMHSAARISYTLDGKYDALVGEIGIDDSTAGRGSVICRVYADSGDGHWKLKSESPVLRGNENSESKTLFSLNVDLRSNESKSAKRISLLVDYADGGDTLDHADLLNVGLVRAKK